MIKLQIRPNKLSDGSYTHDVAIVDKEWVADAPCMLIPAIDLKHAESFCENFIKLVRDHTNSDISPSYTINP